MPTVPRALRADPLLVSHAEAPLRSSSPATASRVVPRALGTLGLRPARIRPPHRLRTSAPGVAQLLAGALDATAVLQTYSRLVIDCNRDPSVPSSMPELSEATPIPGNVGLVRSRSRRPEREIFAPYHARIAALLDARRGAAPHRAGGDAQLHPGVQGRVARRAGSRACCSIAMLNRLARRIWWRDCCARARRLRVVLAKTRPPQWRSTPGPIAERRPGARARSAACRHDRYCEIRGRTSSPMQRLPAAGLGSATFASPAARQSGRA